MDVLAPFVENPWCLALFVVLAALLIGGAAVIARAERIRSTTTGFPRATYPTQRIAASAPLEALAVLHARLLDLQHHLPPGSDDARWLRRFASHLRDAMDEAYARVEAAPTTLQSSLLERLGVEVEALAGVINLQLGATLAHGTDRQALEAQLAALREALR